MVDKTTGVVIVGGGQAGLAMSEHLQNAGIPHMIFERNRIAESWRTARWDSLSANGPAWHDKFPGMNFETCGPDDFATKDDVVAYFESYARKINAPVYTGVEVTNCVRNEGHVGYIVTTSNGTVIAAESVVVATGGFQIPVILGIVNSPNINQIHSSTYRNPDQLPEGNVLVVGAGSSGAQIAEELSRSGRKTYLSVGKHDRPPRSYRNRDFVWWLGVLNMWDSETTPGADHTTIAVSGAYGGHTIDFRKMANDYGITLLGHTSGYRNGVITFAPDLAQNIALGDANYLSLLQEADAYVEKTGINLPEEQSAKEFPHDPESLIHPILELDLQKDNITTIIWATGFTVDYSWMKTNAIGSSGLPIQHRGLSAEPGIYYIGLPWQTRRGSSFIWGVWHDARLIAEHIAKQHSYLAYVPSKELATTQDYQQARI